jgi:predicted nucleic acid-binding Zn ribbon protein
MLRHPGLRPVGVDYWVAGGQTAPGESRTPPSMPEPSFPPDSIRTPLVVRRTVSVGAGFVIGPSESGIFVKGGLVLGALGPGTHLLDPRAIPFLSQVGTLAGVDTLVVTQAVHGVRIRGATGEIFDAAPGLALSPRIFGEVGVRIVDSHLAALVATSVPSGDPDALLRGHIQQAIIEGAKNAMVQAGQEGRLVRLLTERAAQPELSQAIAHAAGPRLAAFGVEITAFGSVVVALSEEDMAKIGALDATAPVAPVYEMLWDCRFCGTKKLLGLTHRHCPSCGAPQNAEERYFPTDAEKVPAKEHEYYGADVRCTHCTVANSSHSKHCAGCGAPLERATEVARRADQVAETSTTFVEDKPEEARRERFAATAPAEPQKAPGKTRTVVGYGCLVIAILAVIGVGLLLWKRPGGLVVVGHSWKRVVEVERYGPTSESSWCDQTPSEARRITRRREVRSHDKVRDGEDCHTRRVDRGNGTFAEQEECTPRYRDEPVYADKCYYTVDKWAKARSESAEGRSLSDAPRWPEPSLARAGICDGCERQGARIETYTVVFKDEASHEHPCEFDQQRWGSLADGSRWTGAMRVVGGGLDCGSVAAR